MKDAYLAGSGLASALGPDLRTALQALRTGGIAPRRIELAEGNTWPYYAIEEVDANWFARAQRIVQRVALESGALVDRDGPLFVASSSLDIGEREREGNVERDLHSFAERLAASLDWRGPVHTVCTACTSSIVALLGAAGCVQAGECESALVLGVELFNRTSLGGFGAMQLLASDASRPLGVQRSGLVLGEAVAALHLSSQPARWRLVGGANVVDGRDASGIVADAVTAACRQALHASSIEAADIGLVKLQAAGSPASDAIELAALRRVFDPLPPLTTLKAAIGHTLGASGGAEIALLLACVEAGVWPRPDYPLDRTLNAGLTSRTPDALRHLLVSIHGFGGGHTAVVLEDLGSRTRP